MDAVAATHIAPATKKYISKSTVTVIAALFIVLLVFAIGYTVATANWNDTGNNGNPKLNLNLNTFFNSTTLTAFTFINIVLALAVVDKLLRRKYNVHN